jgi:2'-5' RNA ligase
MAIRSFIAVEAPSDIQEALGRVQSQLRRTGARVGWTQPSNIHLTTHFLGDVRENDIPAISEVMARAAANAPPMELKVSGVGAFPRIGPPRTLWAGLEGDLDALSALQKAIEQALEEDLGIPPERREFHAHLTLGRVRSSRGARELTDAMAALDAADLGRFTADEIVLFMSELRRGGSVYTPMARAKFEG